jgi:organic radical activating enzyme
MNPLAVNQVFTSIQGEGWWTGIPAQFVRLQGCNLSCSFCDTPQAQAGRELGVSPKDLAQQLLSSSVNVIIWTGGEPGLQAQGIYEVWDHYANSRNPARFAFHIETNGTQPLNHNYFYWVTVSPKPPLYSIHPNLTPNEIKMVVREPGDLRVAERIAKKYSSSMMSLQPVDNDPDATALVIKHLTTRDRGPLHLSSRWRLSYQVHKVLGIA